MIIALHWNFPTMMNLLIWIFQMFIGFTSQRIVSPLVIILFLVKHQECRCMDFPILPTRLLQSLTIKKAESVQSILKVRIDYPYSYINVQIYSFSPQKTCLLTNYIDVVRLHFFVLLTHRKSKDLRANLSVF